MMTFLGKLSLVYGITAFRDHAHSVMFFVIVVLYSGQASDTY